MNQEIFNKRVYITGLLILSIACFYIIKIFLLHFSDKIYLSNPYESKKLIRRGYIKDSSGHILAISIERNSLYANPEQITNPKHVAKTLSPVIGMSENYILNRIIRKKRFVWLKRKLSNNTVSRIRALNLKGLNFKKEYQRVYPHSELAANIVGFCGVDNNGLEGIEYKYNKLLSGEEEAFFIEKENKLISSHNIILTIDRYVQYVAEKELSKQIRRLKAKQGAIIVSEVNTGRILALAKYPTFNPNKYYKYSMDVRSNFSVVGSFEPGSTMKIFAVAAMLKSNKVDLRKKYFCPGSIDIMDATIKCTGVHHYVDVADVIKYSCNVGLINAMKNVDKRILRNVLSKFGFGEKVGIKLPGESEGILREVNKWSGISKYSIAMGQEISVTSLQLAAAYGAIANGGVYYYPSIIDSIEKSDGNILQNFYPKSKGRIISKQHANILRKALRRVVDGGTGVHAKSKYYKTAGKTGTAQKSKRRGGYYESKDVTSFAGFAPYENPEICVVVILDEPQIDVSGGKSAAPIFSTIVDKVLPYRGVGNRQIKTEDPKTLSEKTLYFDGVNVPDFRGLELADAVKSLIEIQKKYYIVYSFIGTGKVYKQYPSPGRIIEKRQNIVLYLKE